MILTVLIILSGSFFLQVAQAVSSGSDIGLTSWVDVGQTIDLDQARNLFTTISSDTANEIEGTYSLYFNNNYIDTINLYVGKSGLIAVYYNGEDPAAKMIFWESDKLFYFSNVLALVAVGQSLGFTINTKDIKYYDYRYPDANRILIVGQSTGEQIVQNFEYGSFEFDIPNKATVYETSYSLYLSDLYNTQSLATLAIDGKIIGSVTGNGAVYGSYDGYLNKNVQMIVGVMSSPGSKSAGALVMIHQDDMLNAIIPTNSEYIMNSEMEAPVIPTTGITGTTVPTNIPRITPDITTEVTPKPTKIVVKMPTPKVTPQDTELVPDWTVEETELVTPKPTKDSRKPPKVSVDLHGERTNIELGQQSLLKGSIVSFNTNRDKMHAQVIIIPPSGVSVVAADFVKTIAGQYTSDFDLDPGKGKDIEVTIIPNEVGEYKVTAKITYYFGEDKDDNGYEEIKLDIKARPKESSGNSPVETTGNIEQSVSTSAETKSQPGFEIILGITILIICFFVIKR